jgi:hypothetical protein
VIRFPQHPQTNLHSLISSRFTGSPALAKKYFTQDQFDALDTLWQQFSAAVGAPASARSNRKALTGQLPDDVRDIEAQFSLCDDFLPQFAMASDLGLQFSDAWFAATHDCERQPPSSVAGFCSLFPRFKAIVLRSAGQKYLMTSIPRSP